MKKASAVLSVVLVSLFAAVALAARQPLTFEERVKAQEAIERVYYNHRIWPKENPGPKPPFEQMMPREQIEAKVNGYLRMCAALDQFWKRPIQASQLQAEMNRMAEKTKDPGTLRELFAALGNDPTIVAECLVRPVLADRLAHNCFAYDSRVNSESRQRAMRAYSFLTPDIFSSFEGDGGNYSKLRFWRAESNNQDLHPPVQNSKLGDITLSPEEWAAMCRRLGLLGNLGPFDKLLSGLTPTTTTDPFAIRFEETETAFVLSHIVSADALVIEIEQRVFSKGSLEAWLDKEGRGFHFTDMSTPEGAYILPSPDSTADCGVDWRRGPGLDGLPSQRYGHTAVWTGTEMIIWGGMDLPTGARYNPATDAWVTTSTGVNCPAGRVGHTAVWTGSQMVIWGGGWSDDRTNHFEQTGGRYNPTTDTWLPTSTGTNCPVGRAAHTAVWTGSQMIVWGGGWYDGTYHLEQTGGRYNPSSDTWLATSTSTNCPVGRIAHTAVWTGSQMIVWGGAWYDGAYHVEQTGGRYNPSSDVWLPTSTGTSCPSARVGHTAVWTGSQMIVWGGGLYDGTYHFEQTGGLYNPSSDTWVSTSTSTNCPAARAGHTAVWTGTQMVVWGGGWDDTTGHYELTGGRYNPSTNTWLATSTGTGCPVGRVGHTAIWTGSLMVVWGGVWSDGTNHLETSGGRYNPSSDTWTATSAAAGYSENRQCHTAVWTGAEMIAWGGVNYGYNNFLSTGVRYNPATDAWSVTSTGANCPSARYEHTAVWTGTTMIVWGGYNWNSGERFSTGGRYNPSTNAWATTSTSTNCPSARYQHSAVWSGTEMIVWGGQDSDWTPQNTGGRYNPSSDTWSPTSTSGSCPDARYSHTAVWTGSQMIVWGGYNWDDGYLNTGGRYNPSSDSWTATSIGTNCPIGRENHTAVWTGSEMIVWGGWNWNNGGTLNTGGRYNPLADVWLPTSTGVNCPSGRWGNTAVWAGPEMLIWGGWSSGYDESVRRYNATTDSWVQTSGANAPEGRENHTAVWTGTGMLVWGGDLENGGPGAALYLPFPVIQAQPGCVPVVLSAGSGSSYQWYKDGGAISGATSSSYTATANGSYTVNVQFGTLCSKTSDALVVSTPPATPTVSGPSSGCGSVTLTTGSYASYQWRLNGADIAGAFAQTFVATQSGTYAVRVANANGCSVTSSGKSVTVNPLPTPTVTNGSPGCSVPATLSTGAYSAYQWIAVPTPGSGALKIAGTCAGSGNSYYYDVLASPPYTIQSGDMLEYDLYIAPSSPQAFSGIDLMATGWSLRGSGAVDQNGLSAHPSTNLSSWASGKWYHRVIAIPASGVGKSLMGTGNGVFLALEGDSAGTYATFVSNIKITRSGTTQLMIYDGGTDFLFPADTGYTLNSGYSAISESVSAGGAAIPGGTNQNYTATAYGFYAVTVTDANGCVGTSAPQGVPASPSNSLRLTKPSGYAMLSWAQCAGASSYIININTDPASSPTGFSLLATTAQMSLNDYYSPSIPPGKVYWYTVEASSGTCSVP